MNRVASKTDRRANRRNARSNDRDVPVGTSQGGVRTYSSPALWAEDKSRRRRLSAQ